MRIRYNAAITALGGYLPDTVLTNKALEEMVDTNSEWIESRTGIKERRIVNDDNFATSDLATMAVKNLLANAQMDPLDVECIIISTATPDYIMVSTASVVCEKAGLLNAWGVDSNAACSGFLYALTLGSSLLESGRYKNVIVVGADKNSSIVNYTDRNTCILFGDGAGAVLLEQTTADEGIIDNVFKTDGTGREHLIVLAGGSQTPSSVDTVNNKLNFISQNGRVVFKAAVEGMSDTCSEVFRRNDLKAEDINWLVPHQANLRIINAVGDKLGLTADQVKINIDRYGNTTAATIPLCLWDYRNDFKPGDNMMLTAFGAGFSWGATYLKWAKLRGQD
ncbi:MAG: ketoacyl-ACP synthase III [Pedobacter sp.]|nr:MAG: ketoacyl-ACP synthase III [Pedobacter sp.]